MEKKAWEIVLPYYAKLSESEQKVAGPILELSYLKTVPNVTLPWEVIDQKGLSHPDVKALLQKMEEDSILEVKPCNAGFVILFKTGTSAEKE